MGTPTCAVHKLVADVAVIAGKRVLLVKYRDVRKYDRQRGWFLPDDYLMHGEHPNDAARRILRDQTGLDRPNPRLGFVESLDGERPWHLIFHYVVRLRRAPRVAATGNVASAEWHPLERLPVPSELAHRGWAAEVLRELLKRRR